VYAPGDRFTDIYVTNGLSNAAYLILNEVSATSVTATTGNFDNLS
jgi:hypothetical protein